MTPSTIVCKLLLVLLVISPAVHAWPYDCNTTATPCFRPNCTCASYTAPDIIPSNDVPMFVKVSMDDWVVDIGTQLIYGASGPNYTDARGCTPRLTLYTATRYTDFRLAEQVFKDGHEIAVHTVSHSTNYTSTKEKWEYEIGNCTCFPTIPNNLLLLAVCRPFFCLALASSLFLSCYCYHLDSF
jgi:hypothetical protein